MTEGNRLRDYELKTAAFTSSRCPKATLTSRGVGGAVEPVVKMKIQPPRCPRPISSRASPAIRTPGGMGMGMGMGIEEELVLDRSWHRPPTETRRQPSSKRP